MPSESEDQQQRPSPASTKALNHHHHQHLAPPQTEAIPCPRCDSPNTKFCYYNNYNLSQPRHFCKSCRRYWTHGGTLRDVPIGGASRKNTKRPRSSSSTSAATSSSSSSSSSSWAHKPVVSNQPCVKTEPGLDDPSPNPNDGNENGFGFTSLLNSQAPGFLALGGYGLEEISGFGYVAKAVWPFHEVGDFGVGSSANNTTGVGGLGNTLQINSGSEGGSSSVDCFAWPDLSISMPGGGNGFK